MVKKGTTLIEVLVASLLLVIVIGGVMIVYSNSTRMLIRSKEQGIALRYLNNEMEIFNNKSPGNLIAEVNNYSGSGKVVVDANGNSTDYKISITHSLFPVASVTNASAPAIYRLNFTIKWGTNSLTKQFISNPGFD